MKVKRFANVEVRSFEVDLKLLQRDFMEMISIYVLIITSQIVQFLCF